MDARWLRAPAFALALVLGTAAVAAGQLRHSSVADHKDLLPLPHPSPGSGEPGENPYIRNTDYASTFTPAADPPVGGCCVPDAPYCEILSPEQCTVAGGGYLGDGSECDFATDCNDNGYLDACECALDCDANGIPDECDILDCHLQPPELQYFCQDCQPDGFLDGCQIPPRTADSPPSRWGILYAPTDGDSPSFRAKVSAELGGVPVDYFDARLGTPSLAMLQSYVLVFTWANYAYYDRDAMGNVLADYMDARGTVFLGQWCLPTAGNYLGGRIMDPAEGYLPVTGTSWSSGTYAGDDPSCYATDVEPFFSQYRDNAAPLACAEVQGRYMDHVPLTAYSCGTHGTQVVYGPGVFARISSAADDAAARIIANVIDCIGECFIIPKGDCDGNLVPDDCDILYCDQEYPEDQWRCQDCDDNWVPDGCDIAYHGDCNENLIPDHCDIADGISRDENGNGIPDECEGVALDIKPGSCPNPLNRRSYGVLPVALVAGPGFDVWEIDLATIQLSRADGVGGSVVPLEGPPGPHSVIADVATPFDGEPCACHDLEGDGVLDLSMKFATQEVAEALLLNELPSGAEVELVVMGMLLDGTAFQASDCITIAPRRALMRIRSMSRLHRR